MNDETDNLWELLGRAKKPVVSPFFAANVARKVRETSQRPGVLEWLGRQWRLTAAATTAAAILLAGVMLNQRHARERQAAAEQAAAVPEAAIPDYDLINHLDELVAYQENSLWLDSSSEQF